MTQTLTEKQIKLMAVAATEIAPGSQYSLSDLRGSCYRRFSMPAIDFNLSIRVLKGRDLLAITPEETVSIREKGWDWVSANRDALVRIVGTR